MTDTKIKALIAQVEEMIAEQEHTLKLVSDAGNWKRAATLWNVLSGMRQVLAVIKLYED